MTRLLKVLCLGCTSVISAYESPHQSVSVLASLALLRVLCAAWLHTKRVNEGHERCVVRSE